MSFFRTWTSCGIKTQSSSSRTSQARCVLLEGVRVDYWTNEATKTDEQIPAVNTKRYTTLTCTFRMMDREEYSTPLTPPIQAFIMVCFLKEASWGPNIGLPTVFYNRPPSLTKPTLFDQCGTMTKPDTFSTVCCYPVIWYHQLTVTRLHWCHCSASMPHCKYIGFFLLLSANRNLIAHQSLPFCSFNLKVKVLERDTEEFPGGFTFHKRSDYMKDFFNGKVHPYIFHMSWTENKNNKQKFFRQMGSCKNLFLVYTMWLKCSIGSTFCIACFLYRVSGRQVHSHNSGRDHEEG